MSFNNWENLKFSIQGDYSYNLRKTLVTPNYIDFELTLFSERWSEADISFEYRRDSRDEWENDALIIITSSNYLDNGNLFGLAASKDGVVNTFRWQYASNDLIYGQAIQVQIKFLPRSRIFGSASNYYSVSSLYGSGLNELEGISRHNCIGKDKSGNYMCLGKNSFYIIDSLDAEEESTSSESSSSSTEILSSSSSSSSAPVIGNWVSVAGQYGTESNASSFASINNKLYVSTGLTLLEWNGTNAWNLASSTVGVGTYGICAFNNKIYGGGGPGASAGCLYEWDGVSAWVQVAPKLGLNNLIYRLLVYNNEIYGLSFNHGNLLKWNGVNSWVQVAPTYLTVTNTVSFTVHNNKIYAGCRGPNRGVLLEWNGINAWTLVASQYLTETSITTLISHNGDLYAGGTTTGVILKWNGTNAWTLAASPYSVSDVSIESSVVFNGNLYFGSNATGRLLQLYGNSLVQVADGLPQPAVSSAKIQSLTVFNDDLYGGSNLASSSDGGNLYKWVT